MSVLDLFTGKWAIYAGIMAGTFAAGAVTGAMGWSKWHAGQDAIAAQTAQHARESDEIQQRKFSDKAAGRQAAMLATINNQLGDARDKIALLSGRECFGADTAGVLNAVGAEPGAAPASESAGAPAAAATGTGIRFSTDRDAAGYIALCRARYAEVSSQINQILDVEDRRHPPP